MLLALVSYGWFRPPVWTAVLIMVPMAADGLIQLKTSYESTNIRRLVTGILFGYSLIVLFLLSSAAALHFGYKIGQNLI